MTNDTQDRSPRSEDLLETEAHPTPIPSRSSREPEGGVAEIPLPLTIGPYRILESLGQGGMGQVYLAQQEEPLRRKVAVKVIHSHLVEQRSLLRFAAEQKALARMSHPFVAQVFDSGTTSHGNPYFVMEFVEGIPIDRYCDRERLSIHQRLALFVRVCQGVQHAHQKGIIHRDLKPSNILITSSDSGPAPKIIDFGIAKAIDQPLIAEHALTGDRFIGTRGYLSPEMASGDLDPDTRTDVYALGLTLFELLVGAPPFPHQELSLLSLLKQITETDAPTLLAGLRGLSRVEIDRIAHSRSTSPARLTRSLKGDPEWILAKALSRDKDDRYPSAAAFGRDLESHLENLPIEAGAPSRWDRVSKWTRRHRAATAATLLVATSMSAGLVARTLEARRANLEAERANREASRANLEAVRANQAAATAAEVTAFLIDVFEVNDPGTERSDQISARELLDRGAVRIRTQLEGEPLTRAAIMDSVGSTYNALGLPNEGAALVIEALELRREHAGNISEEVAESLRHLTMIRIEAGLFARAEESSAELIEIRKQLSAPGDHRLPQALTQMATVLHNLGRLEESVTWQQQAIALMDEYDGEATSGYHSALNHLGSLYLDMGRLPEAIETLQKCLAVREQLFGPRDDSVAQTLNNLGLAMFLQGDRPQAYAYLARSLEIRERALGPDNPNLCWGMRLIANGKILDGELEQAAPLLDRCLANQETALGRRHPFTAMTLEILAKLRSAQGRHREATNLIREALDIADELLPASHQAHAYFQHTYAKVLRDRGDVDLAREAFQLAHRLMTHNVGAAHSAVAEIETDLSNLDGFQR